MGFRENLKDEIEYQDLTLKELSTLTGISKGSLANYLKENCSVPSVDAAVKIAKALNVSVEYLVSKESIPSESQCKNYPADVRLIADKLSLMPKAKRSLIKNLTDDLERI